MWQGEKTYCWLIEMEWFKLLTAPAVWQEEAHLSWCSYFIPFKWGLSVWACLRKGDLLIPRKWFMVRGMTHENGQKVCCLQTLQILNLAPIFVLCCYANKKGINICSGEVHSPSFVGVCFFSPFFSFSSFFSFFADWKNKRSGGVSQCYISRYLC